MQWIVLYCCLRIRPIWCRLFTIVELVGDTALSQRFGFDRSLRKTRKLCYRKDDRAMRPTYGCPSWQFSGIPDYAHGHYSQRYHGLLFRSTLWMFVQNLKFVALPIPEIIGGTQKIWAVPGNAHAPFSPKFLMIIYSDSPYKYIRQIWSP